MMKLVEMDEKVTLAEQMNDNVGSVIFINKFNIKPDEVEQFLKIGLKMLCILKNNQDSFPYNSTEALVEAVCLSIMLSGNLLSI